MATEQNTTISPGAAASQLRSFYDEAIRNSRERHRKSKVSRFRRWLIEISLPKHDSDLTTKEWDNLQLRYMNLGGTTEEFEALIDQNVLE